MIQSRTNKSALNSIVSLIAYFSSALIAFFSRKIFLESLGAEVLGLRTTISNILSMFSLAEMGLGIAIGYTLYKPIHDNDTKTINEIITIQAWFYRRLAVFVCIGAFILTGFFPTIFHDLRAPLWYTYATFGVLLWEVLMSYLINYRGLIFGASQNGYKLTINTQGFTIIKSLAQIWVLLYVENPYIYYLALDIVVSLIGIYILERMINRDYPWLKPKPKEGRQLLKKYPDILKKTKQIFVHKFAGICAGNVAPLIMWQYSSLDMIAYYGNYMVVVMNLNAIVSAFFGSIGAGIGSLVAEGNKEKIINFFWEFLALRNFLATIVVFVIYNFSHPFISIWVGSQYKLDDSILLLIASTAFITQSRGTQDAFLAAKGLYQDVWAPIVEASLNIGLGVLFGSFWGLPGVLAGTLVSYIVIIVIWKVFFLFREGFHLSVWEYWRGYVKYLLIAATTLYASNKMLEMLSLDYSNFWLFVMNAGASTIVFSILLLTIYLATSEGARRISMRFVYLGLKVLPRESD